MKPKSEHVKFNALKYGSYMPLGEIMPCIRRCCLKDVCPQYNNIYVDTNINYAGKCAVEIALYIHLHQYFDTSPAYKAVSQSLKDEYVNLTIATERIRKQISINPEMTTADNKLAKSYELLSRYQKKLLNVTKEILLLVNKEAEGSN